MTIYSTVEIPLVTMQHKTGMRLIHRSITGVVVVFATYKVYGILQECKGMIIWNKITNVFSTSSTVFVFLNTIVTIQKTAKRPTQTKCLVRCLCYCLKVVCNRNSPCRWRVIRPYGKSPTLRNLCFVLQFMSITWNVKGKLSRYNKISLKMFTNHLGCI